MVFILFVLWFLAGVVLAVHMQPISASHISTYYNKKTGGSRFNGKIIQ